jgi:aminopeptidase N
LVAGAASNSALCGDVDTELTECMKSASFLAPLDSPDHRKYPTEREVQVLHLAIDVTPDFKNRTIESKTEIRFKPILKPVREIKLDAVNLNVHSVTSTEKIEHFEPTDQNIVVTFADAIAPGKEATVTVTYDAEPTKGIYFRTPEMGYKDGDTHLFTQGEEIEARNWYPCFDSPNTKFTSEITCHVLEGMTAISNGRLVSQEKDPSGLIAIHWSQEKPHANYLISLCAGYFKKLEDRHKNVPLAFYTPASEINEATNSFRDTRDIMAFFEEEIGVPYPWPKYDQVCVNDFVEGGMENTSCTTLTDSTLYTDATENIRTSYGLIAHEMAHQWFGDLVTCKDWSDTWLNEGFATYYESLYNEHKNGRDSLLYELYDRATQIAGIPNDTNAIVRRTYDAPRDMFGYLSYPKGSWVLHMLRSQLGVDLYRRCIKTYLERHPFGSVVTEDLRAVIEELSGSTYDQFFDQWVYHAHHPELEINYSWDENAKLAKVSVQQVQKLGDNVLLFNFPLPVRFKGDFGVSNEVCRVKEKERDFYFTLPSAPKSVRIDPEYTLLAKIRFQTPGAMLAAQLTDKQDVIGRLLAVEQLETKKDKDSVAKLKKVLNEDPFYGVRFEAARALRSIHSDEALDALLASTKQEDARVRREVVATIGGFYRETAYSSAREMLEREKNPDILVEALRSIGGYAKPQVSEALLKYLNTPSYRNELTGAAISAMRSQDDPAYIGTLRDVLPRQQADFTSFGFGRALETLAYLSRNEEKKGEVRELLVGHLNDKRERVQISAMNALGTLGDPKAIAPLEKFSTASKESPQRVAAARAVADLRAARKPVDDFKNLRQEVLDLEKSNRELRKELDELKRKVDMRETPAPGKEKKKPVVSPKKTP